MHNYELYYILLSRFVFLWYCCLRKLNLKPLEEKCRVHWMDSSETLCSRGNQFGIFPRTRTTHPTRSSVMTVEDGGAQPAETEGGSPAATRKAESVRGWAVTTQYLRVKLQSTALMSVHGRMPESAPKKTQIFGGGFSFVL